MPLCKVCLKKLRIPVNTAHCVHHKTARSLALAAEEGCYLCARLFYSLPADIQIQLNRTKSQWLPSFGLLRSSHTTTIEIHKDRGAPFDWQRRVRPREGQYLKVCLQFARKVPVRRDTRDDRERLLKCNFHFVEERVLEGIYALFVRCKLWLSIW